MCCRINKALFCIPLTGFGLFIGWLHLISFVIAAAALIALGFISLTSGRSGISAFALILLGLLGTCIYYTKEFICGIRERNHIQMRGFLIMTLISVSLNILSLFLYVLSSLDRIGHYSESDKKALLAEIIVSVFIVTLEIEEQNEPQLPLDNVFVAQQPAPARIETIYCQSSPPYNPTMGTNSLPQVFSSTQQTMHEVQKY